jgi:ABC-type glycerol-3-phosphate transport system permease component
MRTRKTLARRGLFAFMCLLVLVVDLPVVTLVLNSFRSTNEILSSSSIIPAAPSLVNFEYVAQRTSFFRYLLNSLIMAGGGMAVSIAVATLAGYAPHAFGAGPSVRMQMGCSWCKCSRSCWRSFRCSSSFAR